MHFYKEPFNISYATLEVWLGPDPAPRGPRCARVSRLRILHSEKGHAGSRRLNPTPSVLENDLGGGAATRVGPWGGPSFAKAMAGRPTLR